MPIVPAGTGPVPAPIVVQFTTPQKAIAQKHCDPSLKCSTKFSSFTAYPYNLTWIVPCPLAFILCLYAFRRCTTKIGTNGSRNLDSRLPPRSISFTSRWFKLSHFDLFKSCLLLAPYNYRNFNGYKFRRVQVTFSET